MIMGITSLGDVRRLGRTGAATIVYYMITTAISVTIGIILVNIIRPGVGVQQIDSIPDVVRGKEDFSFLDVIIGMVPENVVRAAADLDILPLIVFSLLFGAVLTTIGERGRTVISFFNGVFDATMKIVHIVMWFAPIGVFGLVAGRLGDVGGGAAFMDELAKVGKYSMTVLIGLGIHGFVMLPLFLLLVARRNPWIYMQNMAQALTTAFSTASSSATLPVTMECVEEKNGVSPAAADLVLPVGATVNMDGTALYEAVAAIFIAQSYGIQLGVGEQLIIFLTATLAAIGAAGIPEAGLVTMVLVLQAVGLPLEGIGAILAVDWFLDRFRTTVNVWGDAVGAAVVEKVVNLDKVGFR
jgi:Na+/H+-dicarboxylate symporter